MTGSFFLKNTFKKAGTVGTSGTIFQNFRSGVPGEPVHNPKKSYIILPTMFLFLKILLKGWVQWTMWVQFHFPNPLLFFLENIAPFDMCANGSNNTCMPESRRIPMSVFSHGVKLQKKNTIYMEPQPHVRCPPLPDRFETPLCLL